MPYPLLLLLLRMMVMMMAGYLHCRRSLRLLLVANIVGFAVTLVATIFETVVHRYSCWMVVVVMVHAVVHMVKMLLLLLVMVFRWK